MAKQCPYASAQELARGLKQYGLKAAAAVEATDLTDAFVQLENIPFHVQIMSAPLRGNDGVDRWFQVVQDRDLPHDDLVFFGAMDFWEVVKKLQSAS